MKNNKMVKLCILLFLILQGVNFSTIGIADSVLSDTRGYWGPQVTYKIFSGTDILYLAPVPGLLNATTGRISEAPWFKEDPKLFTKILDYKKSNTTYLLACSGVVEGLFANLPNVEQIDIKRMHFLTNVTAFKRIFSGDVKLKKVSIDHWAVSGKSVAKLLQDCASLEELDISDWGNLACVDDMFEGAVNLKFIKLGPLFSFEGTRTKLPEHKRSEKYTEKWTNGRKVWSSSEDLMNNYKGEDAGDIEWQCRGGGVQVNYVDEDGRQIHNTNVISGWYGDEYDATIDKYKLKLDSYELDESKLPKNMKGKFAKESQTVIYSYKQIKGTVTVNYVDEDGKKIHEPIELHDKLGEKYNVGTENYKPKINGYVLDETKLPSNVEGTITKVPQTVTYVYRKGGLSLDELPNFDFGRQIITAKDKYYDAQNISKVKITDSRDNYVGWTLMTKLDNFMTTEGEELKGAQISLSNAEVKNTDSGKIIAEDTILVPGISAKVMEAQSGNGNGTSTCEWKATGVKLYVPGTSIMLPKTYQANLTWTLVDAPVD